MNDLPRPRFSLRHELIEALQARLAESRTDALRASVISLAIHAIETRGEAEVRRWFGVGK